VSCYTRHLDELLPASPRPEHKHALDEAIREALGMAGADCPEVWERVKIRRNDDEFLAFVTSRMGAGE
jgi:hypothetical protein